MGKIKVTTFEIEGLLLLEPEYHIDERGYFAETYSERDFKEIGITTHFVQDNQSMSGYGILRGLHYQWKHPQAKLVRALDGELLDIVVDLRASSKTFGKSETVLLTSENKRQLFVPEGFAHGYLVLSKTAVFSYKCGDYYTPGDEYGILYSDPALNISLPLPEGFKPTTNIRDNAFPTLSEAAARGLIFSWGNK